jgi:hypothetical protein
MELVFDVYMPSELQAGLRGFTDTIRVTVESGEPGGSRGDFIEHMREALTEW